MEEKSGYIVEITPEAEFYYLQLSEYLYQTHSEQNAVRKADEILDRAMSPAGASLQLVTNICNSK